MLGSQCDALAGLQVLSIYMLSGPQEGTSGTLPVPSHAPAVPALLLFQLSHQGSGKLRSQDPGGCTAPWWVEDITASTSSGSEAAQGILIILMKR